MIVDNIRFTEVTAFQVPNTQGLVRWHRYQLIIGKEYTVDNVIMGIEVSDGGACEETEHVDIVILGSQSERVLRG